MYALSIKQPWLDLILFSDKIVENRNWKLSDKYLNTPILLCSSKKFADDYLLVEMNNVDLSKPEYYDIIEASKDRLGLALGVVSFTGKSLADNKWTCPGSLYAHEMTNIESLDNPFAVKGKLMIFNVDFRWK